MYWSNVDQQYDQRPRDNRDRSHSGDRGQRERSADRKRGTSGERQNQNTRWDQGGHRYDNGGSLGANGGSGRGGYQNHSGMGGSPGANGGYYSHSGCGGYQGHSGMHDNRSPGYWPDNRSPQGPGSWRGNRSPEGRGGFKSPPSGSYGSKRQSWGSPDGGMMDDVSLSKALSFILRHGAEKSGFKLMPGGFIYVDEILKRPKFQSVTMEDVIRIVKTNDKQRYSLAEDKDTKRLKICANQGHTIQVDDLNLRPITDASEFPMVIHGTYWKYWEVIQTQGMKTMGRNHMHFAPGVPGESGVISGMRSSCEILIFLDLAKALKDGIKFFLSANNVILSPGDKDGVIYPYYFENVVTRQPRQLLKFDRTICSSQVVSPEQYADDADQSRRKKKSKKKKNKNRESEEKSEEGGKMGGSPKKQKAKEKQSNMEDDEEEDSCQSMGKLFQEAPPDHWEDASSELPSVSDDQNEGVNISPCPMEASVTRGVNTSSEPMEEGATGGGSTSLHEKGVNDGTTSPLSMEEDTTMEEADDNATVLDDNPRMLFTCHHCPSSFTNRSNLNRHERSHMVSTVYSCRRCAVMCSRRSDLMKHYTPKHAHHKQEADEVKVEVTAASATKRRESKKTQDAPFLEIHAEGSISPTKGDVAEQQQPSIPEPAVQPVNPPRLVLKRPVIRHSRSCGKGIRMTDPIPEMPEIEYMSDDTESEAEEDQEEVQEEDQEPLSGAARKKEDASRRRRIQHLTFQPAELDMPSGRRMREVEVVETFQSGELLTRQTIFRFFDSQ